MQHKEYKVGDYSAIYSPRTGRKLPCMVAAVNDAVKMAKVVSDEGTWWTLFSSLEHNEKAVYANDIKG